MTHQYSMCESLENKEILTKLRIPIVNQNEYVKQNSTS